MNLHLRTLEALDWPVLLEHLSTHAHTQAGSRAARDLGLALTPKDARFSYAQVEEVRQLSAKNDHTPVGAVTDIEGFLERAGAGAVLECPDLIDVTVGLKALTELKRWHYDRSLDAPLLWNLVEPIEVEPELLSLLESAFDGTGQLSSETWPQLGELRRRARSLKERIKSTLDDIVRGSDYGEILQERFVTERNGRFVVPIKASHRRGLGIVHDRSRSGETVFLEPAAVVELHNELGEAEAELRSEEHRILSVLSRQLGRCVPALMVSLGAAVRVDLAVARSNLGDSLRGTIPTIGEEGVIVLHAGRHPVLTLRGVEVVANDLRLDTRTPALVLTGPNTGGKTVALKLLGLAALMVRAGIPVPATDGSRVDFFGEVLADIGDHQSITGDLSTFSGHILVVKALLNLAKPGSLLLLDEIAVGTDPAQGAALARAALEALLQKGSRIVVTTHYAELKSLGLVDPRFQVAAVQYAEGRPTYRVEVGMPGSSHALAIAGRLGLPNDLLERARQLLDSGNRVLDEALSQIEGIQNGFRERERVLMLKEADLTRKLAQAEARELRLQERAAQLEEQVLTQWRTRLRAQEEEVKKLVATLQQNPDMRQATAVLETIRATRQQSFQPPAEVVPEPIGVGDKVRLRTSSRPGEVVQVSGERAEVLVGGLRLWANLVDLTRMTRGEERQEARKQASEGRVARRETRKADREVREQGPSPRVRTSTNTCDLRGFRLEEAVSEVELFLDRLVRDGQSLGFLLHGHGTGALKSGLRGWLPTCPAVRKFRAADADEGGDAFTMVEVKVF